MITGFFIGINPSWACVALYDYGDAPASYATLSAAQGAYHLLADFRLGALIDGESDGHPNFLADGDGSDEDGVFFGVLKQGSLAEIEVELHNPNNRQVFLNAWMDFNGDGYWDDPEEQIFIAEPLSVKTNLLRFDIPDNASLGDTYARFRVSTAQGISFFGDGGFGEVEDYKVTISDSSVPVPSSIIMLGIGLLGLVGFRRNGR